MAADGKNILKQTSMRNNHIVIMAGGVGSRFWPLSTPEYPKQFIDILGCGRTLIQLTVDRFKGICPMTNFWVVTNAAYVEIVKRQLPDIPAGHILAEPAASCRRRRAGLYPSCRLWMERPGQLGIAARQVGQRCRPQRGSGQRKAV